MIHPTVRGLRLRRPCFVMMPNGHAVETHLHFRGACLLPGVSEGAWAQYRAWCEKDAAERKARWGTCMLCGAAATHTYWIGHWADVESFAILCCDCRMDRPVALVGEEVCDGGCGIAETA